MTAADISISIHLFIEKKRDTSQQNMQQQNRTEAHQCTDSGPQISETVKINKAWKCSAVVTERKYQSLLKRYVKICRGDYCGYCQMAPTDPLPSLHAWPFRPWAPSHYEISFDALQAFKDVFL